jgi:capsid protein
LKYLSVLDQYGNKIPRAALSAGAFEAAGSGRRLNVWGMSSAGPNTVLSSSLSTLRAQVRELTRNNPIAESGIESWVANLIGTGLTPRWKIKNQDLKTELQELWADWTLEADAYQATDFYGLQALIARALIESGAVQSAQDEEVSETVKGE